MDGTGNVTLDVACNNTRVLSEFNSTDVTYEVFWTMNSSYLSANGYNATIVIDNFKAAIFEREHIRVGHFSGLHPMWRAMHPSYLACVHIKGACTCCALVCNP